MANNANPLFNGIDFNSMSKLLGNMNMGQLSGMLNGMNLNQLMPMMSKMMGSNLGGLGANLGGLGANLGGLGANIPPGANPGPAAGAGLAGAAAAGAAGAAAASSFRVPPHLAGHPTILALNTLRPFFPSERTKMIDDIIKIVVILLTINSIYPLKNLLSRRAPKAGAVVPPKV